MISKAVSSHREIYENKLDAKNYFSENFAPPRSIYE